MEAGDRAERARGWAMQAAASQGPESLAIRIDGVFDIEAAQAIRRRFGGLADEAEVYVDLTRVREFHDHAVAALAEAIVASRQRVYVRGLRQHQYRMLRYLGVPVGALDPGLAARPTVVREA